MDALSPKFVYWSKTLSKFVSLQLVIQIIGFASGILLVRTLDSQQYAYYTIANTMQSAMSILADSGINIALISIGGKIWQDHNRFSQLINTALQLRFFFAVVVFVVVVPIMLWMLISNGTSTMYAVLISIFVLLGINAQLTTGVLDVVPQLHSQLRRLQNIELIFNISRFIFIVVAFLTYLNAAIAVLTASIALMLKRYVLKSWITDSFDINAQVNDEDRKSILRIVRIQAPNSIFYCIQGQVTVFLISIFGSAQSIAEVGALGRISVIFLIIKSVMDTIVVPSFSRCQSHSILLRRYWQVLVIYLLISTGIVSVVLLFPDQILWILGSQYTHLKIEVFWMILSVVVNGLFGIIRSLNISKAWIELTWLYAPLTIITQIMLLLFFDFSTTKGVIIFGILSLLPNLILNLFISYKGFSTNEV